VALKEPGLQPRASSYTSPLARLLSRESFTYDCVVRVANAMGVPADRLENTKQERNDGNALK
jgi:hypothetical protein